LNPNIDKQEMRDYLLGTLDADRRTKLDERLLHEPEIYEELLAAEEELIDEYVAGNLSQQEQHQFTTHFAISVERQQKVRFGSLLKKYATSHPIRTGDDGVATVVDQAGKKAPARTRFPFFLPLMRRPALVYAAAVALVLTLLFLWVSSRKPPEYQVREHDDAALITATLAPGSTRSSGTTNRVNVPPKGRFRVRLDLELTDTSFNNYRSELFRESKSLVTNDELKMTARGAQQVVPVIIAGEVLSPGDYQLKLSGVLDSGADEFIDNYSFRVTSD